MNKYPTRQDFLSCAIHEPRLLELERQVKAHARKNRKTEDYCANVFWYKEARPLVTQLVGWECDNPNLNNEDAYDIVYEYLYRLLPDCNHDCMCWG
jgi:hypothetical protein